MVTSKNPELEAALAWYHAHPKTLDQYSGEWVAIGSGGVLAHSKDVKEVLAASKKQGMRQPLLYKVPPAGILALWRR